MRLEGLPERTWLWAWQENRVEFVNSVTGRPVLITFRAPWRLSGFAAQTDPGTEEYYTGGLYRWNQRLALESAGRVHYCSEVGVSLILGGQVLHKRGGVPERLPGLAALGPAPGQGRRAWGLDPCSELVVWECFRERPAPARSAVARGDGPDGPEMRGEKR